MATRISKEVLDKFAKKKNNLDLLNEYGLLYIDLDFSDLDKQLYYRKLITENYTVASSHTSNIERNHNLTHYYSKDSNFVEWSLYKVIKEVMKTLNFDIALETGHANLCNFATDSTHHIDNTTPTAVYYANTEWDDEWGGETWLMNDEHEVIDAVKYVPNRIVILNGNKPHMVRVPTHYSKGLNRIVLATRFKFIDENGNEQYQEPEKDFKFIN
jgi:hypothetical protein